MRFMTKRRIKNWLILISVLVLTLLLADKYLCCYDKINMRYDSGIISNMVFSPDSRSIAFVSGAYYYRQPKGFALLLYPNYIKECANEANVYSYDLKTKKLSTIWSFKLDKKTHATDFVLQDWVNAGVLISKGDEYLYTSESGPKKTLEPNLARIRDNARQYRYEYEHEGRTIQRLVSPDRKEFVEMDRGEYYYYESEADLPIRPLEIYELPDNETELMMLIEDNPEILIQQEFENLKFIPEREELIIGLNLPDISQMKEKYDHVLFGLTC
ncbi:hypothetical protein JW968_01555 [Candidatus Woesearchaeota archaeon]|nr:hypothetical protein [Candidatus Woesearchaeota archaeon]